MTDTINTATDDPTRPEGGRLEHVDPRTLIIGDNVRGDAALDPAFLSRISGHGVLMPITAVRDDTGENRFVRDGQRRLPGPGGDGSAGLPQLAGPDLRRAALPAYRRR